MLQRRLAIVWMAGMVMVSVGRGWAADDAKGLVQRADEAALVGEWGKSTELREQALALAPKDAALRVKTAREYHQLMQRRTGLGEEHHKRGDEKLAAAAKERVDAYLKVLEHLAYLYRNQLVDAQEGVKLADLAATHDLLHAFPYIIPQTGEDCWRIGQEELGRAEAAKEKFFVEVYPLVLKLSLPDKYAGGEARLRREWGGPLLNAALLRVDRPYRKGTDLAYLKQVLTKLPEDMDFTVGLIQFLEYTPAEGRPADGPAGVTKGEWVRFLEELRDGEHKGARAWGRVGLVFYRWHELREGRSKDATAWRSLASEAEEARKALAALRLNDSDWGYTKVRDTGNYIAREADRLEGKAKPNEERPAPVAASAQPERGTGPLAFEKLELKVREKDETLSALGDRRWRMRGGWGELTNVTRCGDRLDVFWNAGVLLAMREKGVMEEMFVDPAVVFEDVVWDGERIWVATQRGGIWVLKRNGELEGKITAAEGLPAADKGMLLCQVEPGRMITAGSYGEFGRGWLADVRWKDGKATVKVFHEANHVAQPGQDWNQMRKDPAMVFEPNWMCGRDGEKGAIDVVVGRDRLQLPLVVDLATMGVKVFPEATSRVCAATSEGWVSVSDFGATFWPRQEVAEGKGWRALCPDKPETNGSAHQGGFAKTVLKHTDGWWYLPGGTWWRVDPKTLKSERLVKWRVPAELESLRRFGTSAHYGMLGWSDGTWYQVKLKEPDKAP